jgi:hypothetical protein
LHKQQESLKHDVEVLKYITQNHKAPADSSMEINFRVHGLTDVAWKTAQSTAAVSYMPYATVQEYADIYSTQDKFNAAEIQAVRDASVSLGPFLSGKKGRPRPHCWRVRCRPAENRDPRRPAFLRRLPHAVTRGPVQEISLDPPGLDHVSRAYR